MGAGPDGRKRVDLTGLPAWVKGLLVLTTVLLVGGLALLTGRTSSASVISVSAVVAAVIAFAFVAWNRAKNR